MKTRYAFIAAAAALVLAGCAKELVENRANNADEVTITATAIAPGSEIDTKVVYKDEWSPEEEVSDLTAEWESGDSFTALEINDDVVTVVKFTTTGKGAKADFKSSGAVEATDNTVWIAVLGDVTVEDNTIICKYDGQDGTLANLGKYAYVRTDATGKEPVFNFADKKAAKKLSYVLRLLLPTGIKSIEFNTGSTNNGGWNIAIDKQKNTAASFAKDAVRTVELPAVSVYGQPAYIAVPAVSYGTPDDIKSVGLIITIMSKDKKQSQGKVVTRDFSAVAGYTGTYDMSELDLIARPLPTDAINLGSVSYEGTTYELGAWAPFNLGGDVIESGAGKTAVEGATFAWGETEPRTNYTKDGYKYYNGGTYTTQLCKKYIVTATETGNYICYDAAGGLGYQGGPGTYYNIQGSKFDAARVKWGSDWCLPGNDICGNILKYGKGGRLGDDIDVDNKVDVTYYAQGTYTNAAGYTNTDYCACVVKANGAELALYNVPFTDNGTWKTGGSEGRYWTSTTDYGTGDPVWWNRAVIMRIYSDSAHPNNKCWIWDGASIRPVLNK